MPLKPLGISRSILWCEEIAMCMIYDEHKTTEVNGFFKRCFRWNVSEISKREHANGYIIQKITRSTTANELFWSKHSVKEPFCHTYFEAWHIVNGKVVNPDNTDYGFDDRWYYNSTIPTFNALLIDCKEKYLTEGCVSMHGEVYWIDNIDARVNSIETRFKVGNVPYAGELLSAWHCDFLSDEDLVGSHSFHSSWDFSNDIKFLDAISTIYAERNIDQSTRAQDISQFFSELPVYELLLDRIIAE